MSCVLKRQMFFECLVFIAASQGKFAMSFIIPAQVCLRGRVKSLRVKILLMWTKSVCKYWRFEVFILVLSWTNIQNKVNCFPLVGFGLRFAQHKTQIPQIYIKLTRFEDNDSRKLSVKYYLLRCCCLLRNELNVTRKIVSGVENYFSSYNWFTVILTWPLLKLKPSYALLGYCYYC